MYGMYNTLVEIGAYDKPYEDILKETGLKLFTEDLDGIVAQENIECDNESGQVLIRTDKEDIKLLNRLRLLEQFVPYRIGG